MTASSRPLRALALVLGGWTTVRVAILWPVGSAAGIVATERVPIMFKPPLAVAPYDTKVPLFAERRSVAGNTTAHSRHPEVGSALIAQPGSPALARARMLKPVQHDGNVLDSSAQTPTAVNFRAIAPGLPVAISHNRFSGSAWALMRGNGTPSLASGGQLGGSQIGMRLFYTPGREALAITARFSSPLSQPNGREAAVGIALRGRNVGIIAEQRIAIDKGGRDAPAVFAYGGVYDVKLPNGLTFNGYAQAGLVGIKSPAAFVDGAVHVERMVLKAEHASLSIGAGAWGGAQPGVSRIDVGPQVVARIAVAETSLRVSAEWRQRVAGTTSPASGPSVTVGFDF
jgi:hypothetical protein